MIQELCEVIAHQTMVKLPTPRMQTSVVRREDGLLDVSHVLPPRRSNSVQLTTNVLLVSVGETVEKATLSLMVHRWKKGKWPLVKPAYMTWEGYNFEDAVGHERMLGERRCLHTFVHLEEFESGNTRC